MNRRQFDLIADLLRVVDPMRSAVRDILVDGRGHHEAINAYACPPDDAAAAISQIRAVELRIRGAFVIHGATEWEVVVGHNDHHRRPGKLVLEIGQVVCLVCRRTYLKVPVRVTKLSDTPAGYHSGIIDQYVESLRYARGDGVSFGEEQAEIPAAPVRHLRKPMTFV